MRSYKDDNYLSLTLPSDDDFQKSSYLNLLKNGCGAFHASIEKSTFTRIQHMAVKGPSRAEMNKDIRRIFVKHGVDTSRINYMCSGRTISLSGNLIKDGGKEIELSSVNVIVQDLTRLGLSIYCELENWSISEGAISKKSGSEKKSEPKADTKSNTPPNKT